MTMTLKQIDNRIMRLSGRYRKVNDDVQELIIAILEHATKPNEAGEPIGDVSRVPKLCRALPPRLRPVFKRFVTGVSPVRLTMGKTAKDDRVSLYKHGHDNYVDWNLDLARSVNWYDDPFNTEPEVPELKTIADYIDSMERLLNRMANDTKVDANKVTPEHVAKVQAFRNIMREAFTAYMSDEPAARANNFDTLEGDALERFEEAARKAA